jgi:glycosyltransferase involved in cell wall biosynthesis
MRNVVDAVVAKSHEMAVTIVALGEDRPSEYFGKTEIRYIPYQADYQSVVPYYQAADLLIHAALVDTFPLTVLEALACETPVLATNISGPSEQIIDGVTGFLTPPGDVQAMVQSVSRLVTDPELGKRMGKIAGEEARKRFDHERQASDYLNWYQEILAKQPRRVD